MFATFTNATESNIQATEQLIGDLQQQLEQARQELAELQQRQQAEQTAKSAAETALEMVEKARKLVAIAYGEAAVQEFNRTLVDGEPVGVLPPSNPEPTEPEIPSPESPTPDTAITIQAVVSKTEPDSKEEGESQVEPVPPLPTPSAIANMKKPELMIHLKIHGLPTNGLTKDLKSRLTAHVLSQGHVTRAIAA